jgi:hypothetical protein
MFEQGQVQVYEIGSEWPRGSLGSFMVVALGLILMWIYFSDGCHFGLVVTCENGKIEASTLNCAW